MGPDQQFVYNQDFHSVVIDCCDNALLAIAVAADLRRAAAQPGAHEAGARGSTAAINDQHRSIAAAIEAGDADAAGGEMHAHLEYLRPYYERAWRA